MGKQGSNEIDKIVLLHHVHCMAAVQMICIVIYWFMIRRISRRNRRKIPVEVVEERAGIRKAYYDKLVDINGLDRAVGDHADIASETQSADSTDKIDNLYSQNEISWENNLATDSGNANVLGENAKKSAEQSGNTPKRSAKNCWEGSSSKRAKTRGKINDEEVDIIKQGFEKVAKVIMNSTREFVKLKRFPIIDESEIWTNLEELNLDDDLITDAYVFLACNPEKLRAFHGCPVERRRDALRAMMRIPRGTE